MLCNFFILCWQILNTKETEYPLISYSLRMFLTWLTSSYSVKTYSSLTLNPFCRRYFLCCTTLRWMDIRHIFILYFEIYSGSNIIILKMPSHTYPLDVSIHIMCGKSFGIVILAKLFSSAFLLRKYQSIYNKGKYVIDYANKPFSIIYLCKNKLLSWRLINSNLKWPI